MLGAPKRSSLLLSRALVVLALVVATLSGRAEASEPVVIPPDQEQAIRALVEDAIAAAEAADELPVALDARVDIHIDRDYFRVTLHPAPGLSPQELPIVAVFHPEAIAADGRVRLVAQGVTLRCGEQPPRPCTDAESEPWRALAARIDQRRAGVVAQIWWSPQAQAEPEAGGGERASSTPRGSDPRGPRLGEDGERIGRGRDRVLSAVALVLGLCLFVFAGVRGRGRPGAPRGRELVALALLEGGFVGAASTFTTMLPLHEHASFVARSDCAINPSCVADPISAWNLSALDSYGLLLEFGSYTAHGLAWLSLGCSAVVLVLVWALARVLVRRLGAPELSALAGLTAAAVLATHPLMWRLAAAATWWPWALMCTLGAALAGLWAGEQGGADSRAARVAGGLAWILAALCLAFACGGNFALLTLGVCVGLGPACWTGAWERKGPKRGSALFVAVSALTLAAAVGVRNYRAGFARVADEQLVSVYASHDFLAAAKPLLFDARVGAPVWALPVVAALAWLWPRRDDQGRRCWSGLRLAAPLLYAWLVPAALLGAAAGEVLGSGYPVGFINHHWELCFSALAAGLGVAWIVALLERRWPVKEPSARGLSARGWGWVMPGLPIALALVLHPRAGQGWKLATGTRVVERELVAFERAVAELPPHDLLVVPPRELEPIIEGHSGWDPLEVNFPAGFYAAQMRNRGLEPARIVHLDRLAEERIAFELEALVYVGSSLRSFQPHEIAAGVVPASLERRELRRLRETHELEPVVTFELETEHHPLNSQRLGGDRVPTLELGFYRLRPR